jgi:hypothetical protein
MASPRVVPDLATFARQVESLASAPEAREKEYDEDTLDCFSTHPYNPVRVRAVWAFSRSEPFLAAMGRPTDDAWSLEEVEEMVDRDMQLMEPTYLQEKTENSDTLRRLLYTAGIAVAAASGGVEASELDAIGRLLGLGPRRRRRSTSPGSSATSTAASAPRSRCRCWPSARSSSST